MSADRRAILRRLRNAEARIARLEFNIAKLEARIVELKLSGTHDAAEKTMLEHYDEILTVVIADRDRLLVHGLRRRIGGERWQTL
jgi:hypothetical protein